MKNLVTIALFAALALSATQIASAGSLHFASAGSTSVSLVWNADNVPAGAVVHSYVVAQSGGAWSSGYQFTDQSWTYIIVNGVQVNCYRPNDHGTGATWSGDPVSGSASMQAGIAGPPAGVVCVANAVSNGYHQAVTAEKWATLVGGNYQVWHGGGGNGLITAATDITW